MGPASAAGAGTSRAGASTMPRPLSLGVVVPVSVHVTRSPNRTRTLSARLVGERLEVRVPADYGEAETRQFVEQALRRLERRRQRSALNRSGDLLQRAQLLNQRYFQGRLAPASVEYVANQQHRF